TTCHQIGQQIMFGNLCNSMPLRLTMYILCSRIITVRLCTKATLVPSQCNRRNRWAILHPLLAMLNLLDHPIYMGNQRKWALLSQTLQAMVSNLCRPMAMDTRQGEILLRSAHVVIDRLQLVIHIAMAVVCHS